MMACLSVRAVASSRSVHMLSGGYTDPETGYFHLHLVSDATGETLITVARAAAAQYANVSPVEHLYPMVRTKKQLDSALAEITELPGLVLYPCSKRTSSIPREKMP